jgi:tetratricopeptide (TPR) repeat protein
MKNFFYALLAGVCLLSALGCSRQSPEKIRYDMEKLMFQTAKLAEKINIQPRLATAADSLALKAAQERILKYYFDHRGQVQSAPDKAIAGEMAAMAVAADVHLAQYYMSHRMVDSAIAAYRLIGTDIPAGKIEIAGASMALALTYRAMEMYDSTIALYDRILNDFYPPLDSLDRVNTDVAAIPIDKIKISQGLDDKNRTDLFTRQALDYYSRLQSEFPNNPQLARTALVNSSRVYVMTEQWDNAIARLQQVKDSTGQSDIAADVVIANIYNGPKREPDKAVTLFRRILERKPDSMIIGSTMLRLGASLCERKEYDAGREVLADLKTKFARVPQLVATAQFYYAQSFEAEGRWDRALSEYQWLLENHPYTEEAFRAARHIPEYLTQQNDRKLTDIWFERAIEFYKNAARIKQGQPLEAIAYSYLSEIYRLTKQWTLALETLDRIHALAPRTTLGARAIYNAATVAYRQLGDSALAQKYLNQLNTEYGTTDSTRIYQPQKPEFNLESLK